MPPRSIFNGTIAFGLRVPEPDGDGAAPVPDLMAGRETIADLKK